MPARINPEHRRFCEALLAASAGRQPPWWVSIDRLALDLRLSWRQAVALADECAVAGYVRHDMDATVKRARLRTDLPHSVCLAAGGWLLLRRDRDWVDLIVSASSASSAAGRRRRSPSSSGARSR
jgi:hypothetical protein